MDAFKIQDYQRNQESYFEYLLNKTDCRERKGELLDLLQQQIYMFTGGDSSVSKVRAQSLMDSMVYVLSLYLRSFDEVTAIEIINAQKLCRIYQNALLWIQYLMNMIVRNVKCIQRDMILIDYQVYNETLKDGFNAFIKYYNYEFNALDHIITFDYPILWKGQGYVGIELFYQYLNSIEIEEMFCHYFDSQEIQRMLMAYRNDYQYYIFNISELILKQMLFHAVLDKNIEVLVLVETDIKQLYTFFKEKTKLEILNTCTNTYYHCIDCLGITNDKVIQYFYQQLNPIASKLYQDCLYQTLEKELAYIKNHQ